MQNQAFRQKPPMPPRVFTARRRLWVGKFSILGMLLFGTLKTPAEEGSEQEPTQTSTANASGSTSVPSKGQVPFATLRFEMGSSPEIADYRRDLPGQQMGLFPDPETFSSGGTLAVMNSKFSMEVLAIEAEDAVAYFIAQLPVRSLRYIKNPTRLSSEGTLLTQGSEIGGYRAGFSARFFSFVDFSTHYEEQRSDRLKLVAESRFVGGELGISKTLSVSDNFGLSYQIQAGIKSPLDVDTPTQYGTQRQAKIDLGFNLGAANNSALTLGSSFQLTRTESFRISGRELGGGGLGSVSPYFEYPLTNSIRLSFRYDIPVIKAVGREEIFSDPGLAGLFGKTFSFSLAVM